MYWTLYVLQEQCTGHTRVKWITHNDSCCRLFLFQRGLLTLPSGRVTINFANSSARDRDQYKSSTVCLLHSLQILLTKSRMARFLLCCLVASILVASHLANALPQELVVGSACQLEVLSLCQFLIYSMLEINALFKCQSKHCSNFTFSSSLCNLSRRSPQTGWSTKNEWTNATDVGPGWPWRTG